MPARRKRRCVCRPTMTAEERRNARVQALMRRRYGQFQRRRFAPARRVAQQAAPARRVAPPVQQKTAPPPTPPKQKPTVSAPDSNPATLAHNQGTNDKIIAASRKIRDNKKKKKTN